mgnify:CR=1 FL=1
MVADGATGLTVNGKSVSDDQTYIVPKTTTSSGSSSSGGSTPSHTHSYDAATHKCSCGEVDPAYAVASVSGKNYLTLSEAITAAQAGNKTMTLAADKTTTVSIQEILDGQHGSIDGLTIELPSGTYGALKLAPTAYAGSNTTYTCPHNDSTDNTGSVTFTSVGDYKQHMSGKPHHGSARIFTRTLNDLTITAQNGAEVNIAGFEILSRAYDGNSDPFAEGKTGYEVVLNVNNLTFSNVKFTAKVEISSTMSDTTIDGVTFNSCVFETEKVNNTDKQALNFSNSLNNGKVTNLKVDGCKFNNCYQGVYTNTIKNILVTSSEFSGTFHNAIAVQTGNDAVNHGAVVISGNTFTDIGDRIIRFNNVGADTQITITHNTADNNSGKKAENTETREVIKAESLAEGVTCNIHSNSWGENKTVANEPLRDAAAAEPCAKIGDVEYISLATALAAAQSGDIVKLVSDVALDADVSISNQITLNLDGKTIETNGKKINVTATGDLTVAGNGIVNNNTEAAVETVNGENVKVRYTMFAVDAGGRLDIENGTFKTKASQIVYTEGTTIIAGGTFENTADDVNEVLGSSSMLCAKGPSAVLTMNGGSIVATAESQDNGIYGIYGANGAHITLNDSVSVHTSLAAIGMNNTTSNPEVVVTINGGEYKTTNTKLGTSYPQFNTVVYLPGKCHVTINGGTFTAEDTNTHIFSVPYVKVGVNLSISNGTFDGKTDVFFTGTQALSGQNEANTIAITGGTFSSNPGVYVAEGYIAYQKDDGTYQVVKNAGTVNVSLSELNKIAITKGPKATGEKTSFTVDLGSERVAASDIAYSENNSGYTGKGVQIGSRSLNNYAAKPAKVGDYEFVIKGGTITSEATGYSSIDSYKDTSVYMLVPGNSNVTFEDVTFEGVLSFDIQKYTSPWSNLNSLTFKNCIFKGIIIGTCPASNVTFDHCKFLNYTNKIYPNNSNPIWWREDTEGSGANANPIKTFTFVNNEVVGTRPLKIERIGKTVSPTFTFKNNTFDISKQGGDTETKNMAINIGMGEKPNLPFTLIDEGNTISAAIATNAQSIA